MEEIKPGDERRYKRLETIRFRPGTRWHFLGGALTALIFLAVLWWVWP